MKPATAERTKHDTVWGIACRLVTLFGPFVIKTIIVKKLGIEYSGLNSLFTAFLTVMNLVNLGFGGAMSHAVLTSRGEQGTAMNAMLRYFRRVYRTAGAAVLVLGLAAMPLMPYLAAGTCPADVNIYVLWGVYLAAMALDYLVFGYTDVVFAVYGAEGIPTRLSAVRYILQFILQAAALILFKSFYAYAAVLILVLVPHNIIRAALSKREYPDVRCEGGIDSGVRRDIRRLCGREIGHRVCSTLLVSTDMVVISAVLGLKALGLYANYYFILQAVTTLAEMIGNGVFSGSIGERGEMSAQEDHGVFLTVSAGWLFLIGGASACMLCFYQPFISVWYSEACLLGMPVVFTMVVYFYAWMFRPVHSRFEADRDMWRRDWIKTLVAAVFNAAASVIMAKLTDSIIGVLIPTVAAFAIICFPWETVTMFRCRFRRGPGAYALRVLAYTLLSAVACGASYMLCTLLSPDNTLGSLLLRIPIVAVVFLGLWFAAVFKTRDFRSVKGLVLGLVRRNGRKSK